MVKSSVCIGENELREAMEYCCYDNEENRIQYLFLANLFGNGEDSLI